MNGFGILTHDHIPLDGVLSPKLDGKMNRSFGRASNYFRENDELGSSMRSHNRNFGSFTMQENNQSKQELDIWHKIVQHNVDSYKMEREQEKQRVRDN